MKISYTASLAGITIACFILSFTVNIAFLWLCAAAVQHFGMFIQPLQPRHSHFSGFGGLDALVHLHSAAD